MGRCPAKHIEFNPVRRPDSYGAAARVYQKAAPLMQFSPKTV